MRAAKPGIMLLLNNQISEASERILSADNEADEVLPVGRFVGMGATKAIPIYLKDKTMSLTSRQIMDGLKADGWTSKSEDNLATVSATLSQLKESGTVRKIDDGWILARTTIPGPNQSWEMSIAQ